MHQPFLLLLLGGLISAVLLQHAIKIPEIGKSTADKENAIHDKNVFDVKYTELVQETYACKVELGFAEQDKILSEIKFENQIKILKAETKYLKEVIQSKEKDQQDAMVIYDGNLRDMKVRLVESQAEVEQLQTDVSIAQGYHELRERQRDENQKSGRDTEAEHNEDADDEDNYDEYDDVVDEEEDDNDDNVSSTFTSDGSVVYTPNDSDTVVFTLMNVVYNYTNTKYNDGLFGE